MKTLNATTELFIAALCVAFGIMFALMILIMLSTPAAAQVGYYYYAPNAGGGHSVYGISGYAGTYEPDVAGSYRWFGSDGSHGIISPNVTGGHDAIITGPSLSSGQYGYLPDPALGVDLDGFGSNY